MSEENGRNKNDRISTGITSFKTVNWMISRHWWFLGLAGVIIFVFILFDSTHPQSRPMYALEFLFLALPLVIIGVLFSLLQREILNQKQTARILAYKHKLSQELAGDNDWEELVNHLARFPSTVAPVEQGCLLTYDMLAHQLVPAARWTSTEDQSESQGSIERCQRYIDQRTIAELGFGPCEADPSGSGTAAGQLEYCLPIRYAGSLLGVLQFTLAEGSPLAQEQEDIFRNVGDEIGIALKVGQDRRVFYEMRTSQTALAERRSVSDYLHDHLGQNLGYLHLKIDQLLSDKERVSLERVFRDLQHMHNAADDAYEVLRNVLEMIHPESAPLFTNLLLEHARKVSDRSGIDVDFVTKGTPVSLPINSQHAVFYAFEETLSNAEKHSRATKIQILAEWSRDHLVLTITDNGVGFDPMTVNSDHHFGLDILRERMVNVNGRINLDTSGSMGTTVRIEVPIASQIAIQAPSGGESLPDRPVL